MYENSFYATVPIDTDAYLNRGQYHEDAFYLLPEEVQDQVNQRAMERSFHSEDELRDYVRTLMLKS